MTELPTSDRVEGRPAPQYGEYAPPGWVSPVAPEPTETESAVDPKTGQEVAPHGPITSRQGPTGPIPPDARQRFDAPPPSGAPQTSNPIATVRRYAFNRFATMLLVVYGAFDVFRSAFEAKQFAARYVSEFRGLGYITGTFESSDALTNVALVSAFVSLPLFLIAVVVAIRRLRAGRNSWLVLLITGAVVNIVTGLAVVAVVMGDPSFAGMG